MPSSTLTGRPSTSPTATTTTTKKIHVGTHRRAAKLEKHRASETSLTCLAYIDVIQEEVELKREVEEKERRDRRARERAERQRNRRKRKGTDLTKAKSFDCDELKGKSEFREYYNKICGEDGSRKGRAKILSTTIVDANA